MAAPPSAYNTPNRRRGVLRLLIHYPGSYDFSYWKCRSPHRAAWAAWLLARHAEEPGQDRATLLTRAVTCGATVPQAFRAFRRPGEDGYQAHLLRRTFEALAAGDGQRYADEVRQVITRDFSSYGPRSLAATVFGIASFADPTAWIASLRRSLAMVSPARFRALLGELAVLVRRLPPAERRSFDALVAAQRLRARSDRAHFDAQIALYRCVVHNTGDAAMLPLLGSVKALDLDRLEVFRELADSMSTALRALGAKTGVAAPAARRVATATVLLKAYRTLASPPEDFTELVDVVLARLQE